MGPQPCQEAFDRYRAGLVGPDALLDCLRRDGERWLAPRASHLHPEDRDDLLQAALEVILTTLPRFRGSAYPQLRSYFFSVLRSRLIDHLRSRGRETVGLPGSPGYNPEQQTEDALPTEAETLSPGFEGDVTLSLDLQRLLSPEEYRVIRLKLEGYRDRDVARILGKAPGTVAALYHRARLKARAYFSEGP
ncbi:MAG: RNA polymerase sigma factor [Armatimonadota bacterium]|nr:RNA polymerase sigma factor [Armatimonadota bacterium]